MQVSSTTHQASARGKWWTAAAVLPGQLTIAFGMFGVVVALPNIITAFGTDVQTVQWVMTAYLIARVIPMPAMGWLIGQFGQRNLYVLGVLGTTLTTVLCGLSWSIESLIVFCTVQGFVGALVMSIGMVMLYEAFPTEQRGLAMGVVYYGGVLWTYPGAVRRRLPGASDQLARHFLSGAAEWSDQYPAAVDAHPA